MPIFIQIVASRHYLLAKSVLPLLLTLTYQLPVPFFWLALYSGSPSQKFSSTWVEPFTILRNAALRLSFGIIRIRYTQKTRQYRSHISVMDHCLTRLIQGTVRFEI